MATDYKSQAIAHDLADRLKERGLGSLGIVESFDTDGNPLITLGAGVALGANAVLKVRPVDWPLAQDILGLAANVYNPHVIQLVTEADYQGATDNVLDPLSPDQLLKILASAEKMGCILEWYQSATSVAPTAAAIIPSNLKSTFHPDQRYPLISAQ